MREIAERVAQTLAESDDIRAIWLFGAVQRDEAWDESDIDLFVLSASDPPAAEARALVDGRTVHLHQMGYDRFAVESRPEGSPLLHAIVGSGEALYIGDETLEPLIERLRGFPDRYRLFHSIPHLDALVDWARDLRQRMARGDERPRRAAARQWEVDRHAAAVLLIERGIYPHNESARQALDARLFVPNMADPADIERFVEERLRERLLPALREWAAEGDLNEETLRSRVGVTRSARLLELAAVRGLLSAVGGDTDRITPLSYRPV